LRRWDSKRQSNYIEGKKEDPMAEKKKKAGRRIEYGT